MKPDHCPLHGIPLQYDGRCWTCDYNAKYKFQLVETEPDSRAVAGVVLGFLIGAGLMAAIIVTGMIVKSCMLITQ